jgi:hypothetical protein
MDRSRYLAVFSFKRQVSESIEYVSEQCVCNVRDRPWQNND